MAYLAPIRSTQEFLRRHVRRDTPAWNFLMGIKSRAAQWHAAWNSRRWEQAGKTHARVLDELAASASPFFFVQIGAHDGLMDDPLAERIARDHWHGLFIEPQPEPFAKLRARYAGKDEGLIFENVAIDLVAGTRTLYRVKPEYVHIPEISGLASFHADRALATQAALGRLSSIEVPCFPLQTLLDRHGIKQVHLLQMDTEGYEATLLSGIDLSKLRPRAIHFEHRHLTTREHRDCLHRLHTHGYRTVEKQFDVFAWLENCPCSA